MVIKSLYNKVIHNLTMCYVLSISHENFNAKPFFSMFFLFFLQKEAWGEPRMRHYGFFFIFQIRLSIIFQMSPY